jgi:hypothetical protein
MRIHKTGSEALAKQIRDRLPPGAVCPHAFEWQIRDLSPEDVGRYRFFQGHITASSLSAAFDDLRVFTMLRDPRERVLSSYFYWKEGAKFASTPFFRAIADMSLIDFLTSNLPLIRRATWNVQARLIAGGQFGGADALRQNVFGPWLSETELIDAANMAIGRFAFIGIAERYEAALRGAYDLLGLGNPPAAERHNITSAKPASYALDKITRADQAVYEAAARRFAVGHA